MATYDIGSGAGSFSGTGEDDVFVATGVVSSNPPPENGAIDGGAGVDTVDLRNVAPASFQNGSVVIGNRTISLTGIERVLFGDAGTYSSLGLFYSGPTISFVSGSGVDYFAAVSGNYDIDAGAGDDRVDLYWNGAATHGVIVGGTGTDMLHLQNGFWADAEAGTAFLGGATYDISGFEIFEVGAGSTVYGSGASETFRLDWFDDPRYSVNFYGRGGDDTISGSRGNDMLDGGEGNDSVVGGDGADQMTGGAGNDLLDGGTGDDAMKGGAGNDRYVVDSLGDTVVEYASAGTDTVTASVSLTLFANVERLILTGGDAIDGIGNALANVITGNDAANRLSGNDGDDTLEGAGGDDVLSGGAGVDTASYASAAAGVVVNLAVTAAQDTRGAGSDRLSSFENLIGSGFADTLVGSTGDNILAGGAGDDALRGGAGNDRLSGGDGTDRAVYLEAGVGVTVNLLLTGAQDTIGSGIDTLSSIEGVTGSSYNDTLVGSNVANLLQGGSGDDLLRGGGGNDTIDGGAGIDRATYSDARVGVSVSLAVSGAQDTIGSGVDTLIAVESLTGSSYNDVLIGSAMANALTGGAGNDALDGGLGFDTLDGGAGKDTFRFTTALGATNVDTILGFSVPDDTIVLGTGAFAGLAAGALAASAFRIGVGALDADDRILYDSSSGALFFDRDGSGSTYAAVQFATVGTDLALTASDFRIV